MTALAHEITVPAYPLGRPVDGRERYGMTPEQARVYRWLVARRPNAGRFYLDFRHAAQALEMWLSKVHWCMVQLVERGWVESFPNAGHTQYAFVQPVMYYAEPRNG